MTLSTVFCPNLDCPDKGQWGRGHSGIHNHKDCRRSVSRQSLNGQTDTPPRVARRSAYHAQTDLLRSVVYHDLLTLVVN